jgi:hypothetical protein
LPAHYRACGLTVRSALSLPELTPWTDGADPACGVDAEIRFAALQGDVADLFARTPSVDVTAREARFFWDDVGAFIVRDGREILIQPLPEIDARLVRLAILGPCMAALLQQRGFLPLHGSAVRIDDEVVAFLGASGAGKSTMAAAFHLRGVPVLTDDIVAVQLRNGRVRAAAGFPQLKLWPDAVAALGGDPEALLCSEPDRDKRIYPVDGERFAHELLPLRCLYVLAESDDGVSIERLPPAEGFLELVSQSYGIGWMHEISGRADFLSRAEIARRVPIRRLRRPSALHLLPEVVAAVERDLAADR